MRAVIRRDGLALGGAGRRDGQGSAVLRPGGLLAPFHHVLQDPPDRSLQLAFFMLARSLNSPFVQGSRSPAGLR
jgi:hypothetical protein